MTIKDDIVRYARSLGFERVGVCPADGFTPEDEHLSRWLAKGYAGDMSYMHRPEPARAQPRNAFPAARSVIALACAYHVGTDDLPAREPRIARYARGRDYHAVLRKRLDALRRYVQAIGGGEARTFVDTGPLLERAAAQRAGIGFIGKNSMLITRGGGSWVFLAALVTSLPLPPDAADVEDCGSCRLCIDACPTEAIVEPYVLDARRCIAYLTIESPAPIAEELRPRLGNRVFGCDICQEVCPHNVRPRPTQFREFSEGNAFISLAEMLMLDETEFRRRFAGSAVARAGRDGLVRNACVVAASLDRADLRPQLETLAADDPSPLVREHAVWAVQRLTR